jgi:hypothetical protein
MQQSGRMQFYGAWLVPLTPPAQSVLEHAEYLPAGA